jgi:DNA invertase Pin-like site-specific DNA recombinase
VTPSLAVLGALAEFERDLIRVRTGEGRESAKARGVKLGRKPKSPSTRRAKRSAAATATANRSANRAQLQCLARHDFPARILNFVFERVKESTRPGK